MNKHIWLMIFAAASIILISFGVRLTSGLLVHPWMKSVQLGISQIGLIFAVAQLAWGIMQPIFGSYSDKGFGLYVLLAGMVCIVAGEGLTLYARGFWLAMLGQGLLAPAGITAASLAPLMSIVGPRLPQTKLAFASGIINSGGSMGQVILAPIVQMLLDRYGLQGALFGICLIVLLMLVPAMYLCKPVSGSPLAPSGKAVAEPAVSLRTALKNIDYILLDLGFFHMRVPCGIFVHPSPIGGNGLRPHGGGVGGQPVHHRADQYCRQHRRRLYEQVLQDEVYPCRHIRGQGAHDLLVHGLGKDRT